MPGETLYHLQNGSDIRGTALEIPGGGPVTLTGEIANRIAGAFGEWLARREGKDPQALRIGVGHDSRVTAEALKRETLAGIKSAGARGFDCGLASTPAMFMGTVFGETSFDGSVMITASHLPMERNGLKFFVREGGLDKPEIREILELAGERAHSPAAGGGEAVPLMEYYAAYLRNKIIEGVAAGDQPLEGLHLVVDAGNGAGGFFVEKTLRPLGADCSGSQFLEPDGTFPNHQPNPENKAAMESICGAVVGSKADLGIIFDTDVDRMSAVLPGGREANRNIIIALTAAILAPEYPGSTIVTDSITSDRLTVFLEEKLGLRHHCFKRGYKNVINEAIRLNEEGSLTPLAMETSGHGALKENFFLDDGAYLAVRLIVAAAKAKRQGTKLESLLEGYVSAGQERELRIPITAKDFGAYGAATLERFEEKAQAAGITRIPSYEGVRLSFPGKGWAILRMSLHDPIMPFNMEGGSPSDLEEILSAVRGLLKEFDGLDLSILH